MEGIIYYAYHKETGRGYVGQTRQDKIPSIKHWKGYFGSALKKYGKNSFVWVVVDRALNIEDLCDKEIYWINRLNTFGSGGYNLHPGGMGQNQSSLGTSLFKEHRKAISQANKGKPSQLRGISRPLKTRLKISESHKKLTDEDIAAIRKFPNISKWDWARGFEVSSATIWRVKQDTRVSRIKFTERLSVT